MVETGILDALLQGLVTGSLIAAGALGLSLLYSIAEVPNFAHGDMITIGAYLVLAFNSPGAIPVLPDAGGLGLLGTAVLVVEQNATEALRRCDRGYVLVNGENAHSGPGDGLLADQEVRQRFLGG